MQPNKFDIFSPLFFVDVDGLPSLTFDSILYFNSFHFSLPKKQKFNACSVRYAYWPPKKQSSLTTTRSSGNKF